MMTDWLTDWHRFIEKNPKGLMPVLRDGETWIQDSDKIAEHLEEKYPHVSLKTPPQYKHMWVEGASLHTPQYLYNNHTIWAWHSAAATCCTTIWALHLEQQQPVASTSELWICSNFFLFQRHNYLHFVYEAERLTLLDLHVGEFLWFCSGLNIFQAFTSYLKVKNPDDKSKDELLKELAALDEHLRAHVRPRNDKTHLKLHIDSSSQELMDW